MKKFLVALTLALVFAPLIAHADTIAVNSMGTYYTVGHIDTSSSLSYPNVSGNFYVGQIAIVWDGRTYLGYCVDLFNDFNLGDSWTATQRTMSEFPLGVSGGPMANPPYAAANSGSHAAWIANTYAPTVDSGEDAAALQLALWLTVFPNIKTAWFDFGANSSAIRSQAWQWYNEGYNRVSDAVWLDGENAGRSQDFLVPQAPVPEPASLLLFGTGLVALAGVARHRMRK
jgi:hypothetical protein